MAPLLSIPLRLGGYFQSISVLLKNLLVQPKKLYAGITGTLFLLTPILNLGSVRIINEFLDELKLPAVLSADDALKSGEANLEFAAENICRVLKI